MSCKPFKTSEANAKAFLKTKGVIDNFLNVIDLGSFRNLHITLRQQAKTKYFPNVEGWNEKLFFENETGTKIYPNKEVFKKIDNINAIKTSIEKKEKAKLLKEEKERKIKEARLQQMRDAKRKGEPYSDEYLFEKTKKIGEPMEKKLRETYFKDSDKRKASDVLEEISKSNHPLNKLAKKLLPYIKENNVDIELSEDSYDFKLNDGTETTAAGIYSHSEKKIILFKNKQYNAIEKLILHESLHAVSNYQLKQNTKTNNDFKKLFEHAKENLPSSYELENIDEFLVGIFSDSRFINELKKLPPIEIKKYDNFLEEILDHLLSFLGFEKETTLYEQAFSIASNILEEQKNYLEQQRIANEEWEEYLNVMPNEPLFSPAEEVKPGVSELFESNPELASIGTTQQYSQYLDTIFPDSKLKGIFEHSGKIPKGAKFDKSFITGYSFRYAFYFTPISSLTFVKNSIDFLKHELKLLYNDYKVAPYQSSVDEIKKDLTEAITKSNKEKNDKLYDLEFLEDVINNYVANDIDVRKGLYLGSWMSTGNYIKDSTWVLLNSKNPLDLNNNPDAKIKTKNVFEGTDRDTRLLPEGYDGLFTSNQAGVVEPEQIHILGSKKDIEGFKEFVEEKQTSLEPTEIKTEKDVVSLEIENQIDELIKLGIIKSKCN